MNRRIPSGMARVRRVVPDEPRRRLVGAVAAEERQVDEARDPEPHVVEPDQDAQPVVGEQPEEQDEAEPPEGLRGLGCVGADDDAPCGSPHPDYTS